MSPLRTASLGYPAGTERRTAQELALNVAFTSPNATVAALRFAAEMADGLGAKMRIVVPQVVPYGRDLDDPDVNTQFTAERACEAARQAGVESDVTVVLCRDQADGVHHALGADGVVLIGCTRRWWRFAERKLARQLKRWGHKVVLVEGAVNE